MEICGTKYQILSHFVCIYYTSLFWSKYIYCHLASYFQSSPRVHRCFLQDCSGFYRSTHEKPKRTCCMAGQREAASLQPAVKQDELPEWTQSLAASGGPVFRTKRTMIFMIYIIIYIYICISDKKYMCIYALCMYTCMLFYRFLF